MNTIPPIAITHDPENKTSPFAVRLEGENSLFFVDLKALSLPGAVREADELGHKATAWINERGIVSDIPSGIVRK